MTPLAEQAELYAAENAAPGSVADHHIRRAFMAGAQAALLRVRAGARPQPMLAECVDFGRAIGSAAERAQA